MIVITNKFQLILLKSTNGETIGKILVKGFKIPGGKVNNFTVNPSTSD